MTREERETIKNEIRELTVIDGMTVAELKIFMKGYELACKKC